MILLVMYRRSEIESSVEALDQLCRAEYGCDLVALLADADETMSARRLRRLTGVTLKQGFAESSAGGATETGALQSWTWNRELAAGKVDDTANPNFVVLNELRIDLPRLIPGRGDTWPELLDEAHNESGLFRVLAGWIDDKLHRRDSRSFRQYYLGEPGLELGTLADIVETVFNHAVAPVFAAFIPGAGLAVPLVLIGVRYGLTKNLEADLEADKHN